MEIHRRQRSDERNIDLVDSGKRCDTVHGESIGRENESDQSGANDSSSRHLLVPRDETLQIEFSAHYSRLELELAGPPAHDLEGHSPDGRIVSVIVRFSLRNDAEFFFFSLTNAETGTMWVREKHRNLPAFLASPAANTQSHD